MAEHVATFLAQAPMLKVVERTQLEKLLSEQALGLSGVVDEATAVQTGKLAGATHLVIGTYAYESGRLQVRVRVVSVETGVVAGSGMEEGKKQKAVLDAVSVKVVQRLGITVRHNRAYTVKKAIGWSAAGLCAVTAGLAIWSQTAYRDADQEYRTSYNLTADEYASLRDRAELHMNLRWWMAGSSALCFGAGAYAFASNRTEWIFSGAELAVSLAPVVLPGGGGVAAVVRF